jgi:hypothetical protein
MVRLSTLFIINHIIIVENADTALRRQIACSIREAAVKDMSLCIHSSASRYARVISLAERLAPVSGAALMRRVALRIISLKERLIASSGGLNQLGNRKVRLAIPSIFNGLACSKIPAHPYDWGILD